MRRDVPREAAAVPYNEEQCLLSVLANATPYLPYLVRVETKNKFHVSKRRKNETERGWKGGELLAKLSFVSRSFLY